MVQRNDSDHNSRGWTFDSMELYINEQSRAAKEAVVTALTASKELFAQAMAAADKAVSKAEAAAEKRQDASNEIRAAMIDQQKNFADKISTDFRLASLEKKIDEAGGQWKGIIFAGGMFVTVATIVISAAAIFFRS